MALSYRAVMEVLKWTSVKETLSQAALVHKHFQTVSDSDELWFSYLDMEGLDSQYSNKKALKAKELFIWLYRDHSMRSRISLFAEDRLVIINCKSHTINTKFLPTPLSIDIDSAAAFISPLELFVCGGYMNLANAFLLNTETLEVCQLPDMSCLRAYHAIIFHSQNLYAFGGVESATSAEKYDLSGQKWTTLSEMRANHSCFNTCSQGNLIYLCGGYSVICETFNTETEEFRLLQVMLGQNECCATAFLYDNEVVCWTGNTLYYVNSQSKTRDAKGLPKE